MAKAKRTPSSNQPPAKRPSIKDRTKIRAQAIKALERPGRRITAEKVVEAARDPKHPLHRDFDWDDSRAAHHYRLDQARAIIASVRVVITTSTKKLIAPAYVRDIEAAPLQGYVATAVLKNEREAAEELLLYETARLQAQLERCREIAGALSLESELEAAIGAVFELRSRLRRGGHAKEETRVGV